MNEFIFIVPGQPVAKARARATKSGFHFTPAKTVNYESFIKLCFHNAYGNVALSDGEVAMLIEANFEIPKSFSKKKKELALSGSLRPKTKPDWDNIGKIVSDALNKIVYNDDSQVVDARVIKKYSDTPCVKISIKILS